MELNGFLFAKPDCKWTPIQLQGELIYIPRKQHYKNCKTLKQPGNHQFSNHFNVVRNEYNDIREYNKKTYQNLRIKSFKSSEFEEYFNRETSPTENVRKYNFSRYVDSKNARSPLRNQHEIPEKNLQINGYKDYLPLKTYPNGNIPSGPNPANINNRINGFPGSPIHGKIDQETQYGVNQCWTMKINQNPFSSR